MQMNKLLGTCLLCAWAWGQQANAQESIKVGDTTRNMITYAPEGLPYNPPLVISLHGLNQDADYQKGQANWEAVADTAKFVVVYPNGVNKAWYISVQLLNQLEQEHVEQLRPIYRSIQG